MYPHPELVSVLYRRHFGPAGQRAQYVDGLPAPSAAVMKQAIARHLAAGRPGMVALATRVLDEQPPLAGLVRKLDKKMLALSGQV